MKYLLWVAVVIFMYLLIVPTMYGQDQSEKMEMKSITRNFVCTQDINFAHKDLTESYNEEIVWEGVVLGGKILVRLYMDRESGLWTIFEVYPDGSGCASTGGEQSMMRESGIDG
tara:strand:+ start:160 stop:501 length:342 start_codon:yes stop_codon:yes gene_type:complete